MTAAPAAAPWVRHEWRIVGRPVPALPLAVMAAVVAVAAARILVAGDWAQARTVVVTGLEMVVPAAAGVAAVIAVTAERSVEVHLALVTPYRWTVARRVALVTGGAALGCAVWTALLVAVGFLPPPAAPVFALVWGAPLLWFTAAGAALGLLAGRIAGAGLLGALWLVHLLAPVALGGHGTTRPLWLFLTTAAGRTPDWLVNRGVLLAQAVLLAAAAWWLVTRDDRLLLED